MEFEQTPERKNDNDNDDDLNLKKVSRSEEPEAVSKAKLKLTPIQQVRDMPVKITFCNYFRNGKNRSMLSVKKKRTG